MQGSSRDADTVNRHVDPVRKGVLKLIHAVMSDSLFLCPWNFPGKNTGVGYHFLLEGIFLTQRLNLSFFLSPALATGFFTTEPPGKPREGESEIN